MNWKLRSRARQRAVSQKCRESMVDCAGGCRPALGEEAIITTSPCPADAWGGRRRRVRQGTAAALLMASPGLGARAKFARGMDLALLIGNVNALIYEASTSSATRRFLCRA
jgi:hypothetical protein